MIHTGRRAFLSLEGSYHGNSLAGLSIGASDSRERIKNLLPHCGKIAPPLDARALRRIEQRLKRRDVAAFVMEPISINLGVLIPEKDVIRGVRDRCRRYGTLFIADEVASGFGRPHRPPVRVRALRPRSPSTTSAAATGCSCRRKVRRCCCCRRWRSISGPPREGWTCWHARYDAPSRHRRPASYAGVAQEHVFRDADRSEARPGRARGRPGQVLPR
jgi:hypothetical protein